MKAMKTAVVTGGAGFLGSNLCDHLLAKGYRVICVDNLETGSLENLAHIPRGSEFEFVYHDVVAYIALVISFAAGVTWVVVRFTPSKKPPAESTSET